ncbi:MAG: sigma-54-dependent Fis family transcriptional regulator [Deltaproteobacteria bacterium]|nr:sigma-54-dependent Fis family transcriptional regulator [Candidatus Anaeroferrophillacea bacterium]
MYEAWEKFVYTGNPETKIENVVHRSWDRCRKDGVNYERAPRDIVLNQNRLREQMEQNETLIKASQSVMVGLSRLLRHSSYGLFLCDPQGYVLGSFYNDSLSAMTSELQLIPGSNWQEQHKGTNAIGTVLMEDIPLRILGAEHFIKENHSISCWASPIKDRRGNTIGVLDITGRSAGNKNPAIENYRISDLVLLGAANISNNFYLYELQRNFRNCSRGVKLIASLLDQRHITVDENGRIDKITDTAAHSLALKKKELAGRNLLDILEPASGRFSVAMPSAQRSREHNNESTISSLCRLHENLEVMAEQLSLPPNLWPDKPPANGTWIGSGSASRHILKTAAKAALSHFPIILQGASGTGKEIIARYIHNRSHRRNGPFIALNCAALPHELIESELFGYADGAFTEAKRGGKPGKFELANEGTIFLDEIGDMPLEAQVAILRVLQEQEISRIGDTKTMKINVRIIAATHQNLQEMMQQKKFRQDLYYRLGVIVIPLPSLNERKEDIRELVEYFVRRSCYEMAKPTMEVDEAIYPYLYGHTWPGNIRELENYIANMVAMSDESRISITDLPPSVKSSTNERKNGDDNRTLMVKYNKQAIVEALKQSHGKIAPAARILGISRTSLYRKLDELSIDPRRLI